MLKTSATQIDFLDVQSAIFPHDIPNLRLLDISVEVFQRHYPFIFKEAIFVGTQHLLETTASLFRALMALGVSPERMYFCGKSYSTSPSVVQSMLKLGIKIIEDRLPVGIGAYKNSCQATVHALWTAVERELATKHIQADTIIVIDDGARCLEEMPEHLQFKYKVSGVEQTRAGLYSSVVNSLPFSLIEVASCAAKRKIESPLIATAVFRQIDRKLQERNIVFNHKSVCGVIGSGAIGNAIILALLEKGVTVLAYDKSTEVFKQYSQTERFFKMSSTAEVIRNADIIFGCTGQDVTEDLDILELSQGEYKVFISCSSEDKEFLFLLKQLSTMMPQQGSPFDDIEFVNKAGCKLMILSGGFPVNFDREPWNVPAKDIELTQCLMLSSIVQAGIVAKEPDKCVDTYTKLNRRLLDPYLQSYIVMLWVKQAENLGRYPRELIRHFRDIDWIIKNSGGNGCCDSVFREFFSPLLESLYTEELSDSV